MPGDLKLDETAFTIGGTLGYNWQRGQTVFGLESDISYLGFDENNTFTGKPVLGTRLATSAGVEYGAFGTLRGRFGVLANEQLLLFVTGGLAGANVKTTAQVQGVDATALNWSGSTDKTRIGYTLGAGAEYMFTSNMSLKVEYMYFDLGDVTTTALGNATVRSVGALNGIDYVTKTELNGSIVRAGLNYKF